jgi:hypothetical protein
VFARLFKRAEASVDNAIGDLGNRVLIAIPFIAALGFAAASLSIFANRTYGPEIGNLVVAGGFVLLGCIIALVVKLRNRNGAALDEPEPPSGDEAVEANRSSIFDDEKVMGIVSAAAPIVLPAMMRTATKNWPLILAAAAGLYVFSRSDSAGAAPQPPTPQV